MRKPNESLNDFVVKAEEIEAEPPRAVTLRPTGEVEVLKPLDVLKSQTKRAAIADNSAPLGLSWFHRSLVAGGAFALGAIALASAIFIAMYDGDGAVQQVGNSTGATELVIASDEPYAEQSTADASTNAELSDASETRTPQSPVRTRAISRFKPRRNPVRPRYVVSNFTPTTLVIYVERGQIKTRIEPQLTTNKKPLTFSN